MKNKILCVILTAALAATLFGCGVYEGSDTAPEPIGAEAIGEEPGVSGAVSESLASETPNGGEKIFRYSELQEPTTLDPNKAKCILDNEVAHMTQECLVRNTAGKIEPGIAESWEISDDGLVYTFHLRDAKWSDGESIKAEDFVYGLQRLMDPATASEYAFIGEYVKNGAAVESGEKAPEELGIKAPDDKTVEITLDVATPYFLSLMGSSAQYSPIRKDIVEKYGNDFAATAEKNVYSGPFMITRTADGQIIFAKNPNYWNAGAIKLDGAELNCIAEGNTAVAMYESGELDFVKLPTETVVNYDDIDHEYMNGNEDYFYINEKSDNKILNNKNFRMALNYGLDRNTYIKLATDGVYSPCNALVMPLVSGAEKTYGEEYTVSSYPLDGDMARAQEFLKKAMEEEGFSDPSDIRVEITTTDAEASKKIAEVAQELWTQALGITITIRQVTYADIYGSVLPNGDYEIGYAGWGPDYSDPYTYLELFKSDSPYNYSNYENAEVDKCLNASRTETDAKKRMDLLNKAEQVILDDAALVPLQYRQQHYLLNDAFSGLNFYFCSINTDWTYADKAL